MKLKLFLLAGAACAPGFAMAQDRAADLPEINIYRGADAASPGPTLTSSVVGPQANASLRPTAVGAADLLAATPGAAIAQNGGLSGLPVLRGLADDRNKILLGGVDITSACAGST